MHYDSTCSIDGCEKPEIARGWCKSHYYRWRRNGDPLAGRMTPGIPVEQWFWSRVDKGGTTPVYAPHLGNCWLWTGNLITSGYGQFFVNHKGTMAHRWAYEAVVGPIPEGLQLDHLCRIRRCVRPAHLEPVSARINVRRGVAPPAANAIKTHCPRGHAYDTANTYRERSGKRHCRECMRTAARRRYAALRATR